MTRKGTRRIHAQNLAYSHIANATRKATPQKTVKLKRDFKKTAISVEFEVAKAERMSGGNLESIKRRYAVEDCKEPDNQKCNKCGETGHLLRRSSGIGKSLIHTGLGCRQSLFPILQSRNTLRDKLTRSLRRTRGRKTSDIMSNKSCSRSRPLIHHTTRRDCRRCSFYNAA